MRKYFLNTIISLLLGNTVLCAMDDSYFVSLGGHIGGDKIASALDANLTQQTIYAHSGLSVVGGYNYYLTDAIAVSLSGGFMFSTIEKGDTNTSLSLFRFPVEALIYLDLGAVRLGGGVVYHLATTLHESTTADGTTSTNYSAFTATPGSVYFLEYEDDKTGIYYGGKFTQMTYERDGQRYCADGLAAYVGQRF